MPLRLLPALEQLNRQRRFDFYEEPVGNVTTLVQPGSASGGSTPSAITAGSNTPVQPGIAVGGSKESLAVIPVSALTQTGSTQGGTRSADIAAGASLPTQPAIAPGGGRFSDVQYGSS